jgi:hypothetical protein
LHLADQGAGDVDLEHPLLWLHLQSPLVYSGEFIFYKNSWLILSHSVSLLSWILNLKHFFSSDFGGPGISGHVFTVLYQSVKWQLMLLAWLLCHWHLLSWPEV